jgi:hypothetical protein
MKHPVRRGNLKQQKAKAGSLAQKPPLSQPNKHFGILILESMLGISFGRNLRMKL